MTSGNQRLDAPGEDYAAAIRRRRLVLEGMHSGARRDTPTTIEASAQMLALSRRRLALSSRNPGVERGARAQAPDESIASARRRRQFEIDRM
jgi:hypothetical protein